MNMMKKLKAGALAFAYLSVAMAPAMADDSEIYVAGAVSTSQTGNPNVLMLIDTSGSMAWGMTTTSTTTVEADRRYSHLKSATKSIISTLPDNINVGVARYNSDGNGGRIIYPLTALSTPANANADGSQNFRVTAVGDQDVIQTDSTGATLNSSGDHLTMGGVLVSYAQTANGDGSMQCTTRTSPGPYIGSGTSVKGLYLNTHPTPYSTTNLGEASMGLRFANVNIPVGATIVSARIVMTHAGAGTSQPSGWSGTYDSNVAISIRPEVQNLLSPVAFTTASPNRINDRSYISGTQVDIANEQFDADGDVLGVDVTSLLNAMYTNVGWATSTKAVAFRMVGLSGNGTTSAPRNRRIYAYHDTPAKAPRLEVVYSLATALTTTMTGVRFGGVDIPQGATIHEAYLQFTPLETSSAAASFLVASDKNEAAYINSPALDST
ncbi:MAG: hypothetical protein Q8J78_11850, partial [Moraxellaceae bacterium]|nr:hypothetical protein [Moraxellaceae bacterium]